MVLIYSPHVKADLEEELSNENLQIKGEIPAWLSGTLVRNGPITVSIDGKSNTHWFDGLAMLHSFSFDNSHVVYTNKFLRTDAFQTVFENKSLNYIGFASDPCRSLFKRFYTHFFPPQGNFQLPNANINVAKINDAYIAMLEIPLPVRFDLKTLNTLGVLDYSDELPKSEDWESAHPHQIPATQETINYLVEYGLESHYIIYQINKDSTEREIIARIPVEAPSYMHSFSITQNYVILTEYPFAVNPIEMLVSGKPFIYNFKWEPEKGTQFLVVNRHTGAVIGRCPAQPFFAFHHVNAFEEDNRIVLDIVCYKDSSIVNGIGNYFRKDSHLSEGAKADGPFAVKLERFKVNPVSHVVSSETLLEGSYEFPRINQQFDGVRYRFIYLTDARDAETSHDKRPIIKYDLQTKKISEWSEEGCYPGEAVFVKSPEAKEEDDGVVMAVVLDQKINQSFLLVLDAKSFQEKARAFAPHVIPPGLHGQYFY